MFVSFWKGFCPLVVPGTEVFRYLSGRTYDVTKDFQKIQLDQLSKQHLDNIDKSIKELMDFVSNSLADLTIIDRDQLVEKIFNLSIAMGKTRVTKVENNIITCDFYLPKS
jgi:CRISPR/Cas system CMR-associated protein Cmr3 (group 5 of RAMP superfamily)